MSGTKVKKDSSQFEQYEYRFERLEKRVIDKNESEVNEEYQGHLEIDREALSILGKEGWLLVQVVFIDDEQCGWFVRKRSD